MKIVEKYCERVMRHLCYKFTGMSLKKQLAKFEYFAVLSLAAPQTHTFERILKYSLHT